MYIPLDFLPDMMTNEHGILHFDAGNVIPIFGIGSIIGRILSGVFINYVRSSSIAVSSINFMLLGVCCIAYTFSHNYIHFVALGFVNGVLFGSTFVLIPLTILELFEEECVTDTYGLVMLSCCITTTFGLPILGELIHQFHTYAAAFYVAGGLYCCSGLLSALLLIFKYRTHGKYTFFS
jgi:MFS family permease